jgi:hypothetical protein
MNFSLLERKRHESKVAKEYCWAITEVVGLSRCGRSVSRVLEFGFHLDSHVYTNIVDHMHTQFRLEPNVPERNYCVSRGVSILPLLPIKFRNLLRPNVPYKGKSKARLFSVIPAQKSRGCLTSQAL